MRQPPSAGPSAVEWTATTVCSPDRAPRRTTSSSCSRAATGGATGMVCGSEAMSASPPALDIALHGGQEPGGECSVECPVVPRHAQVGHRSNGHGVAAALVGHDDRPLDDGLE